MKDETARVLNEALDAIEEAFDPDLKRYRQHMTAHKKSGPYVPMHTRAMDHGTTPHEDAQKHSKAAQRESKVHLGFPKPKPGQSMYPLHPSHYGAVEAHVLAAHYAEKAAKHYERRSTHLHKAYRALATYHHGKAGEHWTDSHRRAENPNFKTRRLQHALKKRTQ